MSVAFVDVIPPNFSQTNATNYTTISGTAHAGRLNIFGCLTDAATTPPVATITHSGGQTTTALDDVSYNTVASPVSRLEVWHFCPAADISGTIKFDFGATTEINCIWFWVEVIGLLVDVSGNGAAAIIQHPKNSADATSGPFSVTLSAGASSRNPVFAINGQNKGTIQSTTPGTGYTQLDNRAQSTEVNRLTTQYRLDFSTTCDCTFSTALNTGMIALELKLAPSPLALMGVG